MKQILFALCAAALAGPACAQTTLEGAFSRASMAVEIYQVGTNPLPPLDASRVVIAAALETMRTRVDVAPRLFQSLRAAGGSVDAQLGLPQPCVLTETAENGAMAPRILCSDAIGRKPKEYAVFYIAEQIGRWEAAGMPECAEKDYMVVSLASRSWMEAGGQLLADRPAADRLQEWWSSYGMDAFLARRSTAGQATLAGLLEANLRAQEDAGRTEAQRSALREEQARLMAFQAQAAAFAADEAGWLKRWNTFDVK
jgi:hypothetical protein